MCFWRCEWSERTLGKKAVVGYFGFAPKKKEREREKVFAQTSLVFKFYSLGTGISVNGFQEHVISPGGWYCRWFSLLGEAARKKNIMVFEP